MYNLAQLFFHTNPLFIYLIAAVVLLLESTGVPIVNSTLLLFLGALISLGRLNLNIGVLIGAAVLGSSSGACLAYIIGLHGGRRLFFHLASKLHINSQKVNIAETWFHKSGIWMVFFSRMTPYIRPFACFPAGISRMPFSRFLLAALAGSVIWCTVMLNIGLALGHRWRLALHLIEYYTIPTLLTLILLIALYLLINHEIKRHLRTKLQTPSGSVNSTDGQSGRNRIEV